MSDPFYEGLCPTCGARARDAGDLSALRAELEAAREQLSSVVAGGNCSTCGTAFVWSDWKKRVPDKVCPNCAVANLHELEAVRKDVARLRGERDEFAKALAQSQAGHTAAMKDYFDRREAAEADRDRALKQLEERHSERLKQRDTIWAERKRRVPSTHYSYELTGRINEINREIEWLEQALAASREKRT